ncbi:MAG: polysaccharide biosynthesis tyrosine autokinase [Planctomycetales bacterium]|nr:polysaccharide biosynthesis tyrosine autokinase [Planctomycetales bacterium]
MNVPRPPEFPPLPSFLSDDSKAGSEKASRDQIVRATLRWLHLAIEHWYIIAISMAACYLLAAFYYLAAPRVYQARAEILVQQAGSLLQQSSLADETAPLGTLNDYVRILRSGVVVEGATQRIAELSRELRVDFADIPRTSWASTLRENLAATPLKQTNVIEMTYRSKSPASAQAVVNAMLDSYLVFMEQYHKNGAELRVQLLQKERSQYAELLAEKERELVAAHVRLGDIGIREGETIIHPLVQRTAQLNEAYVAAQKDRLKWQSIKTALEAAIVNGEDLRQHFGQIDPTVSRDLALGTLGMSAHDRGVVTELERRLVTDRTDLAHLQQYLGDRHPQVVHLNQTIEKTEVYLANHVQSVNAPSSQTSRSNLANLLRSRVQQELRTATEQERQLLAEYELMKREATRLQSDIKTLEIVEAEVERLRSLNQTLTSNIEGIDINQNRSEIRVEVLDVPAASDAHVSPDLIVTAMLSTLFGLVFGAGTLYVRDVLNDRFETIEELKEQLGTSVLATIRQLPQFAGSGLESLQVHMEPSSVESEAFRTLRTTIAFADRDLRCLAVSSPEPGDGKTTVCANLALSYSQAGRRTLIIDADVRKPGMTRLFDMRPEQGLTDLLQASGTVPELAARLVRSTGNDNLHLLPSGPRPFDPTGILSSHRFAELIGWAVSNYDQVLVDCSPALVASDAAIVGRIADGLMLVVQPDKNHRRTVIRAFDQLQIDELDVIGVVINNVQPEQHRGMLGSGYGYGYGTYAYGESDSDTPLREAA